MAIFNVLEQIRRRENAKRGYLEVRTPVIYDAETFVISGHFPKYEDLMFKLEVDEHPWAMKAMNCPGHMLLFGSKLRSYRELPVRYAEPTPLHRNELTGTLHGLLRVRMITQDDAHIFCTEEQIQEEIAGVVAYARYLYELFGMSASAELSTRPDNKLGTDEQWDMTEAALEEALRLNEIPYEVAAGEGAFYGPKIDLHMEDALGRHWQMGTIQLDSQMPSRFGLTYVGPDNTEHPLYVIHRALYGSFERFIGILIEHFGGAFPAWLAPVQVRVLPVGEAHRKAAEELKERLGPSTGSRSTSGTRPSASGSVTPRSRRSRTSWSTATRSRTRRWRYESAAGNSPPSASRHFVPIWLRLLLCEPASRSAHVPHLASLSSAGFNRVAKTRKSGRCLQRFCR